MLGKVGEQGDTKRTLGKAVLGEGGETVEVEDTGRGVEETA